MRGHSRVLHSGAKHHHERNFRLDKDKDRIEGLDGSPCAVHDRPGHLRGQQQRKELRGSDVYILGLQQDDKKRWGWREKDYYRKRSEDHRQHSG